MRDFSSLVSASGAVHVAPITATAPVKIGFHVPEITLVRAMAIQHHPRTGCIVTVDFSEGFREPEMVKKRLSVVISPPIKQRFGLCTVVPLSMSPPNQVMPYHQEIVIPFQLPKSWGNHARWVKGDMVASVGFHRLDLLRLGKDRQGNRIYQKTPLPSGMLASVRRCVLHGLGMSDLTEHL